MPTEGLSSDVRFGATFLDVRYANKAVKGEVLSDKTDAELFLKRPSDGRVVAYNEKVISIYEFINELNIQFQNAMGYKYPSTASALFVTSRFDANKLSDKTNDAYELDVLDKNLTFPERVDPENNFRFSISKDTNGFFIKPYMRHVDRNIIGLLSSTFAKYEEDHNPRSAGASFGDWLTASSMYGSNMYTNWSALDYWSESNAIVTYTVRVTGTSNAGATNAIRETSGQTCIRLNEMAYIQFPSAYMQNMKTADRILIRITGIKFPKLQYAAAMLNFKTNIKSYEGFAEQSGTICMRSIDIGYFIDSIDDRIYENDRATTHFCTEYQFLQEAMNRSNKMGGGKAVVSQPNQPDDDAWSLDTMWSEESRLVKSGNKTTPTGSANTFESLEKYIYIDREIETELTTDKSTKEGLYVEKLSASV